MAWRTTSGRTPVSGCGVVAEAMEMDISEATVVSHLEEMPLEEILPAGYT